MLLNKLKMAASAVLVMAAASLGAGGVLYATQEQDPATKNPEPQLRSATQAPVGDNAKKTESRPLPTARPLSSPDIGVPSIPGPPTMDQLRRRYVELQEELSRHLTRDQVASKVELLEKEVTAAKERTARMLKEQKAADELQKVMAMLNIIATNYADTDAGRKARHAHDILHNQRPSLFSPREK